ncbi:MAG: hypothetical protein ACLGG7_06160 [Bacteriovoracia bacterium]
MKITTSYIETRWCKTQALVLIPQGAVRSERVVYSHGYTANKADVLPWAVRAAENGIPGIVFDWPGHYLGGLNEVERFEDFTREAHTLFGLAWQKLHAVGSLPLGNHVIVGGHSLGALLALKALKLPEFAGLERLGLGVGIGLNNQVETHLFDTEFYKKTLNVRRQLVSPALDSDNVFPWIRDEKLRLNLTGEHIHLIVGEDDMVVGAGGLEAFVDLLQGTGNQVTSFAPKKLPHHEPTLATPHLHAFLKQYLSL